MFASRKNKSMVENYRSADRSENKSKVVGSQYERKLRFRSEIKKIVKQMKEKNVSLK